VLIVAAADDPHAEVVALSLTDRDVTFARFSYGDLDRCSVAWRPADGMTLTTASNTVGIRSTTTIWWRRSGAPPTGRLGEDEASLCYDEVAASMPAAMDSCRPRWVDSPWDQSRAGAKLLQLAAATKLKVFVPQTIVTNSPSEATSWAAGLGVPVVAKAISSGYGIAPYVDIVPVKEFERLRCFPTMLQELVPANRDIRIVTIGDRSFAWERARSLEDSPDWRRTDPSGSGFEPCAIPAAEASSIEIARELGLTFSVQDWLALDDDLTFLEVNPQGQWLFLSGAGDRVGPVLVDHLLGSTP
jgi:hypothetical protein